MAVGEMTAGAEPTTLLSVWVLFILYTTQACPLCFSSLSYVQTLPSLVPGSPSQFTRASRSSNLFLIVISGSPRFLETCCSCWPRCLLILPIQYNTFLVYQGNMIDKIYQARVTTCRTSYKVRFPFLLSSLIISPCYSTIHFPPNHWSIWESCLEDS